MTGKDTDAHTVTVTLGSYASPRVLGSAALALTDGGAALDGTSWPLQRGHRGKPAARPPERAPFPAKDMTRHGSPLPSLGETGGRDSERRRQLPRESLPGDVRVPGLV